MLDSANTWGTTHSAAASLNNAGSCWGGGGLQPWPVPTPIPAGLVTMAPDQPPPLSLPLQLLLDRFVFTPTPEMIVPGCCAPPSHLAYRSGCAFGSGRRPYPRARRSLCLYDMGSPTSGGRGVPCGIRASASMLVRVAASAAASEVPER